MTRRDPAGLGAVGPELVERPTREAAGTQAPEAGEQEVLHKVDSFLNSKHTHPSSLPIYLRPSLPSNTPTCLKIIWLKRSFYRINPHAKWVACIRPERLTS